jgi:Ca2+-binding RTX toxin-like protein
LVAGDLKDLTVSGDGDFVVTNALAATQIRSVNASTSTGAVTFLASNSVVAVTATAGLGVFTFTGGALADTINGGNAADVLSGGAGADTINGGAGGDNITGGTGADIINVGSGTDILTLGADAQTAVTTLVVGNTSGTVSLTGVDVVTGMAAGDIIDVEGLGLATVGANADNQLLATVDTDLTNGIVDNTFALIRGSWIADTTIGSGSFIQNSSGADTLFVIDANQATAGQSFEAVVLIGVSGLSGTASTAANTIITLA